MADDCCVLHVLEDIRLMNKIVIVRHLRVRMVNNDKISEMSLRACRLGCLSFDS